MSEEHEWNHEDIPDEKISVEKIDWVLENAELNAAFHIECGDHLAAKSDKIAAFLISLLSLSIIGSLKVDTTTTYILISTAIYLSVILVTLLISKKPKSTKPVYFEPKNLLTVEMFSAKLAYMKMGKILTLQDEIEINKERNRAKGHALTLSLYGLAALPVYVLVITLVIKQFL